MANFPFAVVGFDLDGTLLDTSGDLAAAVNHALATAGRAPLPVDRVRTMIGGGSRHMLAQGLEASGGCDEDALDDLQRVLLDFYEANIAVHTRPFAGTIDALDALASKGVALGIMTNKVERLARMVLERLGMAHRFAAIVGSDTMGPGTGKPSPIAIEAMVDRCGGGRTAFVGDSIYDVQGARAAGLPVIACAFGFLDRPVAELGADATIDGYADLIPTLERLAVA